MSNEVDQAQKDVVEEFSLFDNWMDRYQYIIDLGRRLPPMDDADLVEDNKIKGCQSQVWMVSDLKDGRLHFKAISDAAIVSGLIAILLRIYNERRPADILESSPEFVAALGLEEHLSPTRSNGLASMLSAIRKTAAESGATA